MSQKKPTTVHMSRDQRRANSNLDHALRRELLALSFQGFELCVSQLLRSLGYEEVRVTRTGRDGRNRDGGWDIEANVPTGLAIIKAIAQVKQYDEVPVQKRYVDELRGSMLRTGAQQGLLITLSRFSDTAKHAAASGSIAPVRLLDGAELGRLMVVHGIGVTKDQCGRDIVDDDYFERVRNADSEDLCRTARGKIESTSALGSENSVIVMLFANEQLCPSERMERQ